MRELKADQVVLDRVEKAARDIARMADGMVLSYKYIYERWKIGNNHRLRQLRRRLLRDHGRLTDVVRGEGIQLCPAGDGVRLSSGHVSRSFKSLKRSAEHLANTNVAQLDTKQQAVHVDALRTVGGLVSLHQDMTRRVRALASGKEAPIVPDAAKVLTLFK